MKLHYRFFLCALVLSMPSISTTTEKHIESLRSAAETRLNRHILLVKNYEKRWENTPIVSLSDWRLEQAAQWKLLKNQIQYLTNMDSYYRQKIESIWRGDIHTLLWTTNAYMNFIRYNYSPNIDSLMAAKSAVEQWQELLNPQQPKGFNSEYQSLVCAKNERYIATINHLLQIGQVKRASILSSVHKEFLYWHSDTE